ncbi:MAG: ATP synthase F1 subunit epsilon [Phycisphaeraceae bacterium]|nr:ATP synthase F1 subunit epsilon [Phycisphaeraceae bacterium]
MSTAATAATASQASSKSLTCKVITPDGVIANEPVVYASIPAHDGQLGVLPGRAPIVAKLGFGLLTLKISDRQQKVFLVEDGFVQVSNNTIRVLASSAKAPEELDEQDAKAELAEAQARRVPKDHPDPIAEQERISRQMERAKLQLRLIRERDKR